MNDLFGYFEGMSFLDSEIFNSAEKVENLDKDISNLDKPIAFEIKTRDNVDVNDSPEKGVAIPNKIDGCRREAEVRAELDKQYPLDEGYDVVSEVYLRDVDGNIVKDPEGGARRIDFVVVKDGTVVDSIEVTSLTADKTEQIAKENRIRDNGGNYMKDDSGNLIEIPDDIRTRIERRD